MDQNSLLEGRFYDLSERAFTNDYLTHTSFLSASELNIFHTILKKAGTSPHKNEFNGCHYVIYGGHEDADRNLVCFLPGYLTVEDFLISETANGDLIKCLHITPLNSKFADALSHRDFLGALMNMGIDRSKIGDILVSESCAYAFVLSDIADIIADELTRVKHTSVHCVKLSPGSCDIKPKFIDISGSVASERLDAILAMVFRISRGTAQELIKSENVFIDGRSLTESGYNLKPGERISVRGHGKFIFDSLGNVTKKGRIYAHVRLYS